MLIVTACFSCSHQGYRAAPKKIPTKTPVYCNIAPSHLSKSEWSALQTVSPAVQEPLVLPGRWHRLSLTGITAFMDQNHHLHPWLTGNWGHGRSDKNGHVPNMWGWFMQSKSSMILKSWSFQKFQGPRSTAGANKVSPCILPTAACQLAWLRGWACTLPACCTAAQLSHLSSALQGFVPGKFSTRTKPRGHWYTNIPWEYSRTVKSVSSHSLEHHQGPHRTSQLWSNCTNLPRNSWDGGDNIKLLLLFGSFSKAGTAFHPKVMRLL